MTRILIVDDHAIMRRGLREVLSEGLPGAQCVEVGTFEEALASLEGAPPALMLLDINLPGRSGLELLELARTRFPKVLVLVISAYPEQEFAVRCLRLGAAGYLTKSSAPDELLTAVTRVLGGGHYVSASLAARLATVVGGVDTTVPHDSLSRREMEVLGLLARGKSLKEISGELHLSEKTVATYRARLGEKLGLSTNVELTRYAMRHGLAD